MQTNCQQLSRCYSTLHRCTCFSGDLRTVLESLHFFYMFTCVVPACRTASRCRSQSRGQWTKMIVTSLDLLSQNALDDAYAPIRSPLIRRSPASDHERLATMSTPSRRDEERNQPHRFRNADVIRDWSVKSFEIGAWNHSRLEREIIRGWSITQTMNETWIFNRTRIDHVTTIYSIPVTSHGI